MDNQEEIEKPSSANLSETENCPICFGPISGKVGNPDCCQHKFCLLCIKTWVNSDKTTCPLDRKTITKITISSELSGPIEDTCYVKRVNFGEVFYDYLRCLKDRLAKNAIDIQEGLFVINDYTEQVKNLCANNKNCIIFHDRNNQQITLAQVLEEIRRARGTLLHEHLQRRYLTFIP